MTGREPVVSIHRAGWDTGFPQLLIQQVAAAGSLLPVHDAHVLAGKIRRAANVLGVSAWHYEPLFPDREGNHLDFPLGKKTLDSGKIVLAAQRIAQVRAGHVDFPLVQPLQSLLAGRLGRYQVDVVESRQMLRQQRHAGIAPGYQQPFPFVRIALKDVNFRLMRPL